MKKLIIGCLVAGMTLGAMATGSFSYQGLLTNADGSKSSNSMPTITFRIYDGPSTTTVLWGKTYPVTLASDGLFTVEVTDASGSSAEGTYKDDLNGLFAAKGASDLYIGLTVQGSTGEISPRQKMTPVPVASYAKNVTQATGDFTVSGKATFNSAVEVKGNLSVSGTLSPNTLTVGGTATLSSAKVSSLMGSDGKSLIPAGTIWMWYGSTSDIPSGWAICNGSNGTPDLRDRFIVGAGSSSYPLGSTGGEATHTLTTDEMPKHSHKVGYNAAGPYDSNHDNHYSSPWEVGDYSSDQTCKSSETVGGDKAHENRPPYYALYFIMKL